MKAKRTTRGGDTNPSGPAGPCTPPMGGDAFRGQRDTHPVEHATTAVVMAQTCPTTVATPHSPNGRLAWACQTQVLVSVNCLALPPSQRAPQSRFSVTEASPAMCSVVGGVDKMEVGGDDKAVEHSLHIL